MCTYIYVINFPIFCAIWLKKCDFLKQKLGIKKDPDPKLFIPDPDPSKISGSDRIRIRIHNTANFRLCQKFAEANKTLNMVALLAFPMSAVIV